MHRALKRGSSPSSGSYLAEGNFLGKDGALETMWFIQKTVSPSVPTMIDAIEQED